ncbi:MAG TPA: ParB/RepB/Spo0J family partition protein, partial [Candidatus Synoicihabitans sp.]|nr:ParB/RepB/Spo0J family partition protein [Candidatus Synoicihabitans sp.]
MKPNLKYVATCLLTASPTNPRKDFAQVKLDELAESIRQQGVLQPILVRPIEGATPYQIVVGERRWRATTIAELPEIPCVIREMSDDDVREAQHVENLQREHISPEEEAESLWGMLQLKTADGLARYTASRLAERFGVTVQHIHRRLLIRKAPPAAKSALREGKIAVQTAVAIARIPDPGARDEAAAEILKPQLQVEPLSYTAAAKLINEKYMHGLKGASFALDDAELLPVAGPCTTCPKMSDNCGHLFSEDESREFLKKKTCCDPACYRAKLDAVYAREASSAKNAGKTVLPAAACSAIYPAHITPGEMDFSSPYVDVARAPDAYLLKPEVSSAPSWKELIAEAEEKTGATVPRFVARDQRGIVHEIVERDHAIAAVEKSGEPIFRVREKAHPRSEDQFAKDR